MTQKHIMVIATDIMHSISKAFDKVFYRFMNENLTDQLAPN